MLRHLAGALVLYWVALSLATCTPLGAVVDLAHRDQLLEPIWPHIHLADGRIVPVPDGAAPRPSLPGPGVAIGPGTVADAASAGLALTPPLPVPVQVMIPLDRAARSPERPDRADRLAEAPPDPPPDSAAS